MNQILEGSRVALCLVFFIYASWSDYKTREVSNSVWILFAPLAFALTFAKLILYPYGDSDMFFYGLSFGLTTTISIILFYTGGFGGADAKALMCLALILPFYPVDLFTPMLSEASPLSLLVFPLMVFSNAVLLAAALAVYMLLRNVFWREKTGKRLFEEGLQKESSGKKILVLLTGYRVHIEKLKEKWHVYPLEDIEETAEGEVKRKLIVMPRDEERNAIVDRLAKAVDGGKINGNIWSTPGLPMLIFITVGLIIALFFGDVVWILVRLVLR